VLHKLRHEDPLEPNTLAMLTAGSTIPRFVDLPMPQYHPHILNVVTPLYQ